MKKTPKAFATLCAISIGCGATAVQAQEESIFPVVQDCDILAAHPADPERMADGIAEALLHKSVEGIHLVNPA